MCLLVPINFFILLIVIMGRIIAMLSMLPVIRNKYYIVIRIEQT